MFEVGSSVLLLCSLLYAGVLPGVAILLALCWICGLTLITYCRSWGAAALGWLVLAVVCLISFSVLVVSCAKGVTG